ncbi:MAG: hypothetical protein RML45_01625 [Acetobacteraceae bacterium]|nr:hypothetical protein [Acetobacteraceae bacterium]
MIARIRAVTDKPIRHLVLTHYHAVRVLGAAAYRADAILASDATRALIAERGAEDMASEIASLSPASFAAATPSLASPGRR